MSEARPPESGPDEHDAWLHQALRHAPDATVAPPNALREAILAEARSAVRTSRAVSPRSSFIDQVATFWSWLARPQVAAGFAGVMAATLVGMMWWDRPMDEALAPPPSRTVAQPEAVRPPATPPVADTLSATGSAAAPTTLPAATAPSAFAGKRPTPTTSATTTATKAAPKAAEEDKQRKDQAPMNAIQSAPVVSPFPSTGLDRSEAGARNQAIGALAKKEDTETRTTAAPPPRVVAPEPSPAAAPAEAARSADAAVADAKSLGASGELAKAAPTQRQRAATTTRDTADALVARGAPAPSPQAFAAAAPPAREADVAGERRAAVDASARPMVALLGSLSGNPERWTRPAASRAPAPVSAATEAWLASVDAATAGRWQARAERTSRLDGALFDDANALLLSRDGRVTAVVRIEEGGVFFELQPGPAWFAPLPADVLARLRAGLPPIGR